MAPELLVAHEGAVAVATMNRPERRNALDTRLFAALREFFVDVAGDDSTAAIVLTGAGSAFSSGGDLDPSEPSGADFGSTMRAYGETTAAVVACPKPVIAAIEGVAAGAGVSLVLACDLAVVSRSARLGLLFVRLGLSLDCGASWLLPRAVGPRRAKELALLGDWVDAATAERIGLVNRVVDDGDALTTAREWATRIASTPTAATAIKRGIDDAPGIDLATALEREALAQAACSASSEFLAALERFRTR